MTQMVSAALAFSSKSTRTAQPSRFDGEHIPAQELEAVAQTVAAKAYPRRPQRFTRRWPLRPTAVRLARIHARTWLTTWRWAGDQDEALIVIDTLMANAVKHGGTAHAQDHVELALLIDEDDNLVIGVSDPNPKFEGFAAAMAIQTKSGLSLIQALGGEITWGTPDVERGKTVQVRMRASAP
ncbi:ATP-binding protein [Streptomyces massasporeus]|uniref:ATP-binding protein n=1 Tax=Streptomyces massasporeus TaxID=67324 RepID=UPI003693F418